MGTEEKSRWLGKLREANGFCLQSKMILHAVQIHTESSQSRHSWTKTQDNQLIQHVYTGVEKPPASRPGGLEYSGKDRHGWLMLDRFASLVP